MPNPSPPSITDDVFAFRELTYDRKVNDCIAEVLKLSTSILQGKNTDKIEDMSENVEVSLYEFELSITKLDGVRRRAAEERKLYQEQQKEAASEASSLKSTIVDLEEKLVEAKKFLAQLEEYEVIKKQINKLPPKEDTQREIDEFSAKITETRRAIAQHTERMEAFARKHALFTVALRGIRDDLPDLVRVCQADSTEIIKSASEDQNKNKNQGKEEEEGPNTGADAVGSKRKPVLLDEASPAKRIKSSVALNPDAKTFVLKRSPA
eukprot:35112_1